jgi:hypothetical protein
MWCEGSFTAIVANKVASTCSDKEAVTEVEAGRLEMGSHVTKTVPPPRQN